MPCVENLVSYCFVLFVLIHVDSTRVKLIIIVLYTDKLAKTMYLNVDDDDETDDDELNPPEVKSIESNDNKIKKENYGPYDEDTDGEEQPEEVKSNNLDVKIEEEDTRTMNESKDMKPVTNPSLG